MDSAGSDLEHLMTAEDLDWIGRKLIDECRSELSRPPLCIILIGSPIVESDACRLPLHLASGDLFGEFFEDLGGGLHEGEVELGRGAKDSSTFFEVRTMLGGERDGE